MEFQDELAGGVVLVRPALQSPGYVAGTSGWAIKIDGSAEFNNVTVRGTLQSNNYVAGTSGWKLDQAGTAELNQLTARGTVQSSNYVAGTSGWQVNTSGSAEFNQLTARGTVQSSNYVAGTSGWQVNTSGSAEFNNITLRGGTSIGGSAFYYNGTPALGNLILSIASAAGTDAFGNAYLQGLGVYGSDGTINALGSEFTVTGANGSAVNMLTGGVGEATVDLVPRDLAGATWYSASLFTTLGASNRPGFGITSPAEVSHGVFSSVEFYGGGPTTTDTTILFSADTVNFSENVSVSGVLTATNIQSGSVSITPTVVDQWTASATVTFPTAFVTVPAITLTCTAGGPATGGTTQLEMCAASVTTTGFSCRIRRGSLGATTLNWLAVSTP
jgi:hypothetical protein